MLLHCLGQQYFKGAHKNILISFMIRRKNFKDNVLIYTNIFIFIPTHLQNMWMYGENTSGKEKYPQNHKWNCT